MKQKIRKGVIAASTAMLVFAMASSAIAETALRFVSWQVDEPGNKDWWAGVIAEFEETNPDVTIEFTKVARENYLDTMTTMFASGSPPDIVHLAVFEVGPVAQNGWLEDLGPYVERSGMSLENWTAQSKCVWEGETVCIMLSYFGGIMAYNQRMLDEAGIGLPTDWDSFLAAARAMTKDTNGDGIIDQWGTGHQTTPGGSQYISEMMSYMLDAGAFWTDAEGNPQFDKPEMIEGLRRWKVVLDEKLTPLDMRAGEVRQLFADGRIGMRIDGPWMYGIMREAPEDVLPNLAVTAPPFDPPYGGSSHVIAIPSEISDDRKELVWEFIQLATSEKWQLQFASITGAPAPRPGAVPDDITESVPHFQVILDTMAAASAAGVDRVPIGFESEFNEFAKIVETEAVRMVLDDRDPAEVGADIQSQLLQLQAR